MKLKELRKNAIKCLADAGNVSPHADVDFILVNLIGVSKSDIIIGDKELTAEETKIFETAVERIRNGEPVQYVVGFCEFMSLKFRVNSSTLIPRADTETLVETVIDFCKHRENVRILEIGCGSGCVSVSLAHYLKNAKVFAIDISKQALKTAEENAKELNVADRISFFEHDIMSGFPEIEGGVDVVVSNPPYIPSRDIDELERKVKAFEPRTALDGGTDGLDFYRKISECAKLNAGGLVAFEVGYDQAVAVKEIMHSCGYKDVCWVKDLSGINRVVKGYRR